MSTTTAVRATSSEVLDRFLAGYWTTRTRDNYRFILTRWLDWCHEHILEPVGGVDAAALEAFISELNTAGYVNTIASRVWAVSAFYRWCVREQLVVRNPVELSRWEEAAAPCWSPPLRARRAAAQPAVARSH